jgi:hypothetical protein
MRIIDLFALQIFAKNLGRCNFRLLQHYPGVNGRGYDAARSLASQQSVASRQKKTDMVRDTYLAYSR